MRPNNYHSFVPVFFIMLFALISVSFVIPESSDTGDKEKKTRHCTRILKELAKVSGLKSVEIPRLEVVDPLKNQSLAIAMIYDEGQPVIQIHEWTYDICMEMLGQDSTNGLAFIIAHELAHLTKNHLERNLFKIDASIDSNDVEEVESLDEAPESRASQNRSAMDSIIQAFRGMTSRYNIRKNEAEADLYAGFTAYLAGYDTRKAGPVFFDHTYNFFTLNNEKGKYVSKNERKIIVEETSKQLDTLIQIFEMANLLTIAGQYEMATTCYQHVNKIYSSPALLNNIGLALILETMVHLDKDKLPYYLPFTLNTTFVNAKSRGFEPPVAGDGEPPLAFMIGDPAWIEGSVVKLKESIDYFKQIQIRHPNNYEAFLNESIANFLIVIFRKQAIDTLWSDTDDYIRYAKTAAFKAKNAIDFGEPSDKGKSDVHCMISILDHYTGNIEKAIFHYHECAHLNHKNFLLKKNRHIVDGSAEVSSFAGSSSNSICEDQESVFGTKSLETLYNDVNGAWDISVTLRKNDQGEALIFTSKNYEKGRLSNVELLIDNVAQEFYSVFQTNDKYTEKSACGMAIGMEMEKLEARYGSKPKIIQSKSGSYHSYNLAPFDNGQETFTNGTIFYSANSETVDRWFMYEKMVTSNQNN